MSMDKMVSCIVMDLHSETDDELFFSYCHCREFRIYVTKSNERTKDSFESKSLPFCLTFH